MKDKTENIRKLQQAAINKVLIKEAPLTGALVSGELESHKPEKTWNTTELSQDFDVLGFMAPYVVVRRKSDGVKGSLQFKHSPRIYFNFKEE